MNRKDYEFAKMAARNAYEQALLDAEVGEGGLVPHSHTWDGTMVEEEDFIPHNHLGEYAPYDHEHDAGVVEAHDHDEDYAEKEHTHNYASSTHTHSSVPSHSHNYASSSHTHSGMGGTVRRTHGTKTNWDSNWGHYGSDKVFIKYRPSSGSLYEATSSSKVSDTGEVAFIGNLSGFQDGYGKYGVLIAHTHTDMTYSPYLRMEVFHTQNFTNYGQRNHWFRGLTTWVRGDAVGKSWSQAPALYWTWLGEDK